MLSLGWTQFCARWKQNFLMVLQIAVVMLIAVFFVTTYKRQTAQYAPFKEIMSGEGAVCALDIMKVNDFGGVDAYLSQLNGIDTYDLSSTIYGTTPEGIYIDGFGYSDTVSEYKPQLIEGKWYTEVESDEYLPVVITQNVNGYRVGDILELSVNIDEGKTSKFIVCGILQKGASYYNITYTSLNMSVHDFFKPYDHELDDTLGPMMFYSKEKAEEMGYVCQNEGLFIIKYSDDLTDAEIEENDINISGNMDGIFSKISDVRTKTEKEIMIKIMPLLAIGIGIFVLVSVGIACLIMLESKSNMKSYAIFYAHGMNWGGCAVISLIQSLLIGLFSMITAFVAGNIVILFFEQNTFFFEWGNDQIITCLLLFVYMMVISMIIPVCIFKKNTPVDVLRSSRD